MISFKSRITGILFVLLGLMSSRMQAQSDTLPKGAPRVTFDSAYMADYTNVLTSRVFFLFQNASIMVNPASEKISTIEYHPNANVRIGLAGFWKWFGLGLSIDNPFYKTNQEKYGKTATLDLRVNAFGRNLAGELFVQQYKGFYLSSPERPDGTYYILPDMRTFSIGIAGYWIYNSGRFSIRAAFIQNERQKKSAGSLVVRPGFLYYRISSGQGIIPAEIADTLQIPAEHRITGGRFYSYGLSPGYVYTFVFLKNCYITAAAFPGVAAQVSSYTSQTKGYNEFEFVFQLSTRVAIGYNSDKWFLGGSIQTGFNEIPDKLSNAQFSYDVAQIRFWGGTRFDVFRKKKKNHTH